MKSGTYSLTVNESPYEVEAPSFRPLALVLREDLGLTGTKVGCLEGRCGSCTVLVAGRTVAACLYPVGLADGLSIRTVEALAERDGPLHPLQEALLETGGVQCGICTPGMLMTLSWLLEANPSPTEAQVRETLAGNICRCTGYQKIVDSVLSLAQGDDE